MDRKLGAALLAEGIGTFLFFTIGAGSIIVATDAVRGSGLVTIALAHGLVLAVLVSAFGAISGGHFNPAVTAAVLVAGKTQGVRTVLYFIVQSIGAIGTGLFLVAIFPEATRVASGLGTPALADSVDPLSGVLVEFVATLVLLFAVLGTAVDPRGPKIGGLAIGLAIAADIMFAGPLTGASMNPARWLGPALVSGNLANAWVYLVGPFAASIVAGLLWRYVFAERSEA